MSEYWQRESDSSKKVAQEIAKTLRHYEESVGKKQTDRASQSRIDGLSMQQERNLTAVNQLLDSNSGFTEQSKFLVWCMLRQRPALERPAFRANP